MIGIRDPGVGNIFETRFSDPANHGSEPAPLGNNATGLAGQRNPITGFALEIKLRDSSVFHPLMIASQSLPVKILLVTPASLGEERPTELSRVLHNADF
jgi:hypothetical protein